MDKSTRSAAIAAAVILVGFGLFAFYLPTMMLAVGSMSPFAGGLLAIVFVLAFFGIFWLRGRSQAKKD
ncbi:hypothetical protein [Mesorhizobium sp. CAU 1741]|uniref:hypothetical protein n=1 Tax=Mesorhizobium sp. CAU 1741 TaxID=3140366 RepID=UPI00325B1166